MASLIDFLNYQPLCGEVECGPMELGGIRLIHIIGILIVAWLLAYTWMVRDE